LLIACDAIGGIRGLDEARHESHNIRNSGGPSMKCNWIVRSALLGFIAVGTVDRGLADVVYSFSDIPLSRAESINDAGQIVSSSPSLLYSTGTFPSGINDSSQIVGVFDQPAGVNHGFLYSGGAYTTIDYPGATETFAYGINNNGQIVGTFGDATGDHGYIDTGGSFAAINVPGGTDTVVEGINDKGQIVGNFFDTASIEHGFLYTGGSFTEIDLLGQTTAIYPTEINDQGQIVGYFYGSPQEFVGSCI
jgi:probable HAF family extracellular repeat protein